MTNAAPQFDEYRPLLFSIAYRMLGSVMDAEDMVQEAWLRWQQTEQVIESPKAYLSTIITRLCLDQLKSARHTREVYVGPWLPEPLLTDPAQPQSNLTGTIELAESLSMAFLVVLESLSPAERAVFLLHEVFDYEYPEIAQIVEKSEANCRQMAHRARQHLASRRPRYNVSEVERNQLYGQFVRACTTGDLPGLINILTDDIVLRSDGGGKAQAARNPIYGSDRVARFLLGIIAKANAGSYSFASVEANGQPAIVVRNEAGRIIALFVLDLTPTHIQDIYAVVNPDKLAALQFQP